MDGHAKGPHGPAQPGALARGHAGASGGHWHPRTAAEVIRCIAVTLAPPAGARLHTHPLPVRKGKPTKITKSSFMTQVAIQPPVFALFVGHPDNITPAYLRFLENQLREEYGFEGT
ncbi:MAG: hypothetical protein AAB419_12060, partial [Pseudomonadota bacterium]